MTTTILKPFVSWFAPPGTAIPARDPLWQRCWPICQNCARNSTFFISSHSKIFMQTRRAQGWNVWCLTRSRQELNEFCFVYIFTAYTVPWVYCSHTTNSLFFKSFRTILNHSMIKFKVIKFFHERCVLFRAHKINGLIDTYPALFRWVKKRKKSKKCLPPTGIEPVTLRSSVLRSPNWAKAACFDD